jgi:hypothetical protein
MRHQIMGQAPRQSQVAASVATANIDNDQTNDTAKIEPKEFTKQTEKKRNKLWR